MLYCRSLKCGDMLVVWLLLLLVSWRRVMAQSAEGCSKTKGGIKYKLIIGQLSATTSEFEDQASLQAEMTRESLVDRCFQNTQYVFFAVNGVLNISTKGWTGIEHGIFTQLNKDGVDDNSLPNIIIGPFYTNLAMMLQRMGIPYLVTSNKGFEWIDMSRVQDRIKWKTVVEIRPPAQAMNLAVVDFFLHRKWMSAIMVMPESAADNQECQNLAGQMLNRGLSLIPFTVNPRGRNYNASVVELLRNARLSRQTRIIVCSPRDSRDHLIESVLYRARLLDILQNKDFSFIFVDPSSHLKPFSGASEMYRLGLFSARCELLAFRYIKPNADGFNGDEDKAAARDAARITSYALEHYLRDQMIVSNDFDPKRFLKALKSIKTIGRTGNIEFDQNGQRVNYTLALYNHGGEIMNKEIAKWNPHKSTPEARLTLTGEVESNNGTQQHIGIFPDLVRIVVVEEYPFVVKRDNPLDDDLYEGFTIDLIKKLAQELKFQYEIYRSPGNVYGAYSSARGTWDGMVNEVMQGNATLACGAISITSTRESAIDFSLGVLSTGVNLLVKRPDESFTIFQFMMPFSLELWMAIVGASALVTIVFYCMDYCSVEDRRFTFKETIWFTIGTLLKRGSDFAPVPVSQRILTAGFLFFVLITVSTYTANMAAFLTIKNFGESVDSFEALSKSKTLGVSTVINSATMSFLRNDTKKVYRDIWSKVESSKGQVKNATEGQKLVKAGTHAFIFDYLINEAAQNINCELMAAASPILLQEHGIGMKAGAPFKTLINIALLKLKEDGFIAKMKKKWWDDKRSCDLASDSQRTGEVKFGLDHTAGVFIVGLFGVCVAAMLFISKKLYLVILNAIQKHRSRRKKAPEPENYVNNGLDDAKRERLRLYYGDKGEAV
ncbi:glutamate receptor 2-like [Physella acuta]|uniref:glutamate receptor 2-like n=1 Tax=Physella acuta TaxID=109671 RepID=UPI0027DB3507|nr:glutamate receptor 2-like [Physella acuta]